MPARTGAEYLTGLREQTREIWLDGERVPDATEFPGLANAARSIAALYDMQHRGPAAGQMTYTSPTTGDPVGLSFLVPRTSEDLALRRTMMSQWAHATYGMMGRNARLPQRNHHGDGGGRRLLRGRPARIQAKRPELL